MQTLGELQTITLFLKLFIGRCAYLSSVAAFNLTRILDELQVFDPSRPSF